MWYDGLVIFQVDILILKDICHISNKFKEEASLELNSMVARLFISVS